MPSSYIQLEITTSPSVFDELIGLLNLAGIEGFWEDGSTLKCYVDSGQWSSDKFGDIREALNVVTRSYGLPEPYVTSKSIHDQNWNEAWEKTVRPIQVTERIIITPTWHDCSPTPGQIVLTVDPKMSFGTGYHETTRLGLKLLERHVNPGSTLLDIGTGTGVLAIAGVKLGSARAVAVDNDEWAITNALENVRLNRVESSVTIIHGQLAQIPEEPFDLITANMHRRIIVQLLDGIKKRLAPKGVLLLSGLLDADEGAIIDALHQTGFRLIEELQENEWIALAATRRQRGPDT